MNNEYKDIKEFESKKNKIYVNQNKKKIRDDDKLKILWIVLAVLFVILIVAMILTSPKDDVNNNAEEEISNPVDEKETSDEDLVDANKPELVALSVEDDVYKLMSSYIDAAYIQCDLELVETLVDSMENVNADDNKVKQRYIESFDNIEVYRLDSDKDIFVVFVKYDVKLNNSDTLLPSGEFLLVRAEVDGKPFIHNIGLGEQYEQFMVNNAQVAELNILIEKIQSEYNAVIDSNSEIKSIVEALNGKNSDEKKVE